MKRFVFVATVFILISIWGCNTYNFTTNILVPADITLPAHIDKVGIMNRSLPEKSELFHNILEGFLTGESVVADREGSLHAIQSTVYNLNNGPRFKATSLEGEDYRGTGTKKFPIPLDWSVVSALCQKYNVDAIACLETFDSDVIFVPGSRQKTRRKDGVEEKYTEYFCDLRIRVNAGWRVYDHVKKEMIDEKVFYDEKAWTGIGVSPDDALRKLPNKRSAINDAASFAGQMFAFRISPKWMSASRYVYTKPKKEELFKKGKDLAVAQKWKEAAELWSELAKREDKKIAGRACHNMAVASEMEGNLPAAISWAEKAFTDKGLKKSRYYVNILHTRQMEQKKLNEQMEGK